MTSVRTRPIGPGLNSLIAAARDDADPISVRISMIDGSTVAGDLSHVDTDHVHVVQPGEDQSTPLPVSAIVMVEVARHDRQLEWLLLGGELCAGTVVLLGVTSVPGLYIEGGLLKVVAVGLLGGLGAVHFVLRKRLREWLTDWTPLHHGDDAA